MKAIIVPEQGLIHSCDRAEIRPPPAYRGRIERLLISSTHIRARVARIAREIAVDAARVNADQLHLVVVLKGATVFGADLAREISRARGPELRFNFIKASSYGNGTVTRGEVKIEGSLQYARGRHLLVVEDIIDTGLTMARLKRYLLRERKAASVKICALLNKPDRRLPRLRKELAIDYAGFDIPDLFVAGYGLDCAEQMRELPCVVVVNDRAF